ncbi:hypothetical protein KEM56_006016, partial [Ascosphaera pollenicola]
GKLKIALAKSLLRGDDAMDVFAGKQSHLLTAVAVEDAKEGHSFAGVGLGVGGSFQVEDGGMGVFHADAPALHGGDAVDDAVIATLGGGLGG